MRAKTLIGTASWSDPEFVRDWYPKGVRAADRLFYYGQRFDMVEVNSTFYSIPEPRTVQQWVRSTADDFVFNVKLHKLLSRHSCETKMLPKPLQKMAQSTDRGRVILNEEIERAAVEEFLKGIAPLEDANKLGVLLLQLSPGFSPRSNDLEELGPLLDQLAPRSLAVELRNRNWVVGPQLSKTMEFLENHRASFVSVDAPKSENFNVMPAIDTVTNPEVGYLRLHGRDARAYLTGKTVAERFDYDYADEELEEVKERVEKLGSEVKVVHVVFNNNRSDYAPQAALRFRRVMGQGVAARGQMELGED